MARDIGHRFLLNFATSFLTQLWLSLIDPIDFQINERKTIVLNEENCFEPKNHIKSDIFSCNKSFFSLFRWAK